MSDWSSILQDEDSPDQQRLTLVRRNEFDDNPEPSLEEALSRIEETRQDISIGCIDLCHPDLYLNDGIAEAVVDLIVNSNRQWEKITLASKALVWLDENGQFDIASLATPGIVQSQRLSWFKEQLACRLGVSTDHLVEEQPKCGIAKGEVSVCCVQMDYLSLKHIGIPATENDTCRALGTDNAEASTKEDVVLADADTESDVDALVQEHLDTYKQKVKARKKAIKKEEKRKQKEEKERKRQENLAKTMEYIAEEKRKAQTNWDRVLALRKTETERGAVSSS